MKIVRPALLTLVATALAACGIKGSLYLPEPAQARPQPTQSAPVTDLSSRHS